MLIQMYDTNAFERLLGNICYYALSVAYLKKLGQTVVLHTDALGAQLLGYLPYDEIHLTADTIPDNVSPRFWAAAKMWALEAEPLGAIHIDGDVFIKSEELVKQLEESDWDVLVQSYETAEWYERDAQVFWKDKEFCKNNDLDLSKLGAYNTGIFGFRNQELKDKFIKGYKNFVLHFSQRIDDMANSWSTPDLIPEQKYIYQLSKNYKTKILLILKEGETHKEVCNKLGYQHVITMYKYSQIDKCMDTLKSISEEIYNKTYKLCRNLLVK